ncbi:hypothetical protein BJ508DRAFT_40104 [Ascobolus immersus RN42]|uniref:P-loop containing nucleoside triphosphate hydrolase protein n=1 Tax=Ascobolus immersus RN42 TaxID=1160509 RepID=A0A3N4HJR4_ASCIM|nr:hypothetical protein BJ508DRAFT_40104 [Ascobolus immersus RN42]
MRMVSQCSSRTSSSSPEVHVKTEESDEEEVISIPPRLHKQNMLLSRNPQLKRTTSQLRGVVAKRPKTVSDAETRAKSISFSLRSTHEDSTIETLEQAVMQTLDVLESIESTIRQDANTEPETKSEPARLLTEIKGLQELARTPKTIIGIVGKTGEGKSTLLNALLDEEKLVPTNCMRACTSVVTEVSYNHQTLHTNGFYYKYRAEVEFISPAEWEEELRDLFARITDGFSQDEDDEVAVYKLKALYPFEEITAKQLEQNGIEHYLYDGTVQRILNKRVVTLKAQSGDELFKKLQMFIDSTVEDRVSKAKLAKLTDEEKQRRATHEYWPLIKVVRIFVDNEILRSGAVLVDLPGYGDVNSARSVCADRYKMQCDALWIVSGIHRAVDDKNGRTLLDDTFRRQSYMDGSFQTATYICSKSEDIWVEEAIRNLSQSLKKDTEGLYKQIETEKQSQMSLSLQIQKGKTAFKELRKMLDSLQKRKALLKKKQPTQVPSPSTIRSKFAELDSVKADIRSYKTKILALETSIESAEESLDESESQLHKRQREIKTLCIHARNERAKETIKHRYAVELRELDERNAEEEDPGNYDPMEGPSRSYDDSIASSFPVFCVSAHGYQDLCHRSQEGKAGQSPFDEIQQTEIPHLQDHCQESTLSKRRSAALAFLNGADKFLNSLGMWCSGGHAGALRKRYPISFETNIRNQLSQLKKHSEQDPIDIALQLTEHVEQRLYSIFPEAIKEAIDNAPRVISNLEMIHPKTYAAICRKNGQHKNCYNVCFNVNHDLCVPFLDKIKARWVEVFRKDVERTFGEYKEMKPRLEATLSSIWPHLQRLGLGAVHKEHLKRQINAYTTSFSAEIKQIGARIQTRQKEIHRVFEVLVQTELSSTYEELTLLKGRGSVRAKKERMREAINTKRKHIFHTVAEMMRQRLVNVFIDAENEFAKAVDRCIGALENDLRVMGVLSEESKRKREAAARHSQVDLKMEIGKVLAQGYEELSRVIEGLEGNGPSGGPRLLEGSSFI